MNAGIFCVVKTSNAGGAEVQDLALSDGRPLWQHVALLVAEWGARPRRRAWALQRRSGGRRHASARGQRSAAAAAPVRPSAPRRRSSGGDAGRRRPRIHERAGERARRRLALGHVRLSPGKPGRLASGGRSRGGPGESRGVGGIRLVTIPSWFIRYGLPTGFLVLVTVTILLVRPVLHADPSAPALRQPAQAPRRVVGTAAEPQHSRDGVFGAERRHARHDRGPLRDDSRRAPGAQPRDRPSRAPSRPELARRIAGYSVAPVIRAFTVLLAFLALSAPAAAATPEVDARAYLVMNADNGEVLLARNAHDRLPVASITKLMTALLTVRTRNRTTSSSSTATQSGSPARRSASAPASGSGFASSWRRP